MFAPKRKEFSAPALIAAENMIENRHHRRSFRSSPLKKACVQLVNTSFRKLYGYFIRLYMLGGGQNLLVKTSFHFFIGNALRLIFLRFSLSRHLFTFLKNFLNLSALKSIRQSFNKRKNLRLPSRGTAIPARLDNATVE